MFTAVSNLFVEFGLDKSFIWILSSYEALLLPVVTVDVVFT